MTTISAEDRRQRAQIGAPGKRKTAVASAAGICVENYDFLAYGTAAALYFGDVFFPKTDPLVGSLLAFATLGVGFLVRPLGGILGGYFADKYGRKPVLLAALLVMGIATAVIGLLPTYQSVGILAPILLVIIRVVQGLAFGAEWGGAVIMTYEHAPWRRRGFYTAIPMAGAPVGVGLATLAFLVSTALPGELAWRIPFLGSIALIVVGMIVRSTLNESPEFEESKTHGEIVKNPLAKVIREDWRNILRIIALRIGESCTYYVTATYLLSYVTGNKLATREVALTGTVLGCFLAVGMILLVGHLTDRVGRRKIYIAASIAAAAYAFPVFALANAANPVLTVLAFVISIGVIQAMFAGVQGSWFAELFNTSTRASGASVGYQFAASISGFAPFIATMLFVQFGWQGPAFLLIVVGLIGLVGAVTTADTWNKTRRAEVDAYLDGADSQDASVVTAADRSN